MENVSVKEGEEGKREDVRERSAGKGKIKGGWKGRDKKIK